MPKPNPAVTIHDLQAVGALLDEIEAIRQTAEAIEVRLSKVTDSIDRIEDHLGHRILEVGDEGRRRALMTKVGEQFRYGVVDVMAAWKQALRHTSEMAELEEIMDRPRENK